MKTRYAVLISLLAGLFSAQIIATLQVIISNKILHDKLVLLLNNGHLIIPNQNIMPTLQMIIPAFFGGLFFTLTIGAGISIVSLSIAWIWKYWAVLNKTFLILIIILWIISIIVLNRYGFLLMPSLYAILIPPIVTILFLVLSPGTNQSSARLRMLLHFVVILFLGVLWSHQIDSKIFLNIRDHLLLSNAAGTRLNDFYYRYTLYPAEVFRNLDQQLIKTYHLTFHNSSIDIPRLKQRLAGYDYLPIKPIDKADVQISIEGDQLQLKGARKAVITSEAEFFFKNTRQVLKDLSKQNDVYTYFRAATSFSLLLGFPLLLYGLIYELSYHLILIRFSSQSAAVAAILLCCLIGSLLFYLMPRKDIEDIPEDQVEFLLASDNWKNTVLGLKKAQAEGMDLHTFGITDKLIQHSSIPVRYWLARGLSHGNHRDDEKHLMTLLEDAHPNVVCQALYSIGKRKMRHLKNRLLDLISTSNHWYIQLYTYNTLRKLGWKQTVSN